MLKIRIWTEIIPQTSRILLCSPAWPKFFQPPSSSQIHTTSQQYAFPGRSYGRPLRWPNLNSKIYPPQSPDEERRPAYVCHVKTNIKYSPWKMWYIACMVRGLTVDEALKQLDFVLKKGSTYVKQTILEAQQMAVQEHNVEFKSNLWVAESFVGKGPVIKGIRRHARCRTGIVEYFHCHYFVRLEEGTPPKDYYIHSQKLTGPELLDKWLQQMRSRRIPNSL